MKMFQRVFILVSMFLVGILSSNYAFAGDRGFKSYKKKTRVIRHKRFIKPMYKKKARTRTIKVRPNGKLIIRKTVRRPVRTHRVYAPVVTRPLRDFWAPSKREVCQSFSWGHQREQCRTIVYNKIYTRGDLLKCSSKLRDHRKLRCLKRNGLYI